MRILIIEDDQAIARGIRRGLEQERYAVEIALDGNTGLERAMTEPFGLIILDLMLPGMDGLTLCQELRNGGNPVPILMLTARGAVTDRVIGLQTGADDYLPKPFDLSELIARVQALLRRDRSNKAKIIHIADLEIDTQAHHVSRAGHEIVLTRREYMLLEALATHPGRVLSREVIQERVWMDDESFSNVVDVCVGQLRKKIDAGHAVRLIQTVRGFGYVLRPSCEEEIG